MLLPALLFACSTHKNLAQTTPMKPNDTLIQNINSSSSDTDVINPHLKKLQSQYDLVIAFGTLNFAWARKGTYYVLASKNNEWVFYAYEARLPPTPGDEAATITPQKVATGTAEKIKELLSSSELWKTDGDKDGNFCAGKKSCNINDAETWTLSIATPQSIHTTTYYAPTFFEECCPGNPYRKQFVEIGKAMMQLGNPKSTAPEM